VSSQIKKIKREKREKEKLTKRDRVVSSEMTITHYSSLLKIENCYIRLGNSCLQ
jgi:hypothetical protein